MIKQTFIRNLILVVTGTLVLSGCTNISTKMSGALGTITNPAVLSGTSTVYSHILNNVAVGDVNTAAGATSQRELALSVDTAQVGFTPLNNFCSKAGPKCDCSLSWNEINSAGGVNNTIPRTKFLVNTDVQSGVVKCMMDDAFWSEIASGTVITMNVVSETGIAGFNVKPIKFKKGTAVSANGDFMDDTLTPFRNIYRYSCYSKRLNAFQILNQIIPQNNAAGNGTVNTAMASAFCTGDASKTNPNCSTPFNGYSAQNYYRNLFIRSDKLGEINASNSSYDCPKVLEPIRYSAGSGNVPASVAPTFWPLDTTFALASNYSSDWSVGVAAASVLYKKGDPNSDPAVASSWCTGEDAAKSKRLYEYGIVTKCLGYAKKPNSDGTCGVLTDSNGRVRPMVRLRKYRVIYPSNFKSSGDIERDAAKKLPQEADEVLVADRYVTNAAGVLTGAMIYGPKPCNFAWFDHEGVVNRVAPPVGGAAGTSGSDYQTSIPPPKTAGLLPRPSYVATSKYIYNSVDIAGAKIPVNPDGLIFPNIDRDGAVNGVNNLSCSAALPVVDSTNGVPSSIHLTTTYYGRTGVSDVVTLGSRKIYLAEVHVKPIDPWVPNYIEDMSFQACVPLADPILEPPLHFYKENANTIGWCTESYPTQNPYWINLNAKRKTVSNQWQTRVVNSNGAGMGAVGGGATSWALTKIYTSHDTAVPDQLDPQNSCGGTLADQICSMTLGSGSPDLNDCRNYLGDPARRTCDRTVIFDPTQADWNFPLQATSADINSMLDQDLQHDKSFGCLYSVYPGDPTKVGTKMPSTGCCGTGVLAPLTSGNGGHLEPFKVPSDTTIRFCGAPVQ